MVSAVLTPRGEGGRGEQPLAADHPGALEQPLLEQVQPEEAPYRADATNARTDRGIDEPRLLFLDPFGRRHQQKGIVAPSRLSSATGLIALCDVRFLVRPFGKRRMERLLYKRGQPTDVGQRSLPVI